MFQFDITRNTLNPDGTIKNGFEWDQSNPETYKRIKNSRVESNYFLTKKNLGFGTSVVVLSKEKNRIKAGDYLYEVNNYGAFLGNPTEFSKNTFMFKHKLICNADGDIVHFKYKSRTKLMTSLLFLALFLCWLFLTDF